MLNEAELIIPVCVKKTLFFYIKKRVVNNNKRSLEQTKIKNFLETPLLVIFFYPLSALKSFAALT